MRGNKIISEICDLRHKDVMKNQKKIVVYFVKERERENWTTWEVYNEDKVDYEGDSCQRYADAVQERFEAYNRYK